MLVPLLVLQLLAARTDSVYSSAALREFVGRAAERNRDVPAGLAAYRARVESELAIVGRRPDGIETAFSIEQVQSEARWRRSGEFEQHITAVRSQQIGLSLSMVGLIDRAWGVPVLYGNRLSLFFDRDTTDAVRRGRPSGRQRPMIAVHPFAPDRDRVYRFSGGDTVAVIRSGTREIRLVRVLVEPRTSRADTATLLYRGEIDVDAARGEIVRMRGYFVTLGRPRSLRERLLLIPFVGVAFVELVNAEIEGSYWLPSYQRIEAQGSIVGNAEQRSALRVISRFRDYRVNANDRTAASTMLDPDAAGALGDSLRANRHRLTFAPRDSLDRDARWERPIGIMTADTHVDDFLDIAPDAWRPTGPARLSFGAPVLSEFVHYDRVEGPYTGLAGELRLRDRLPGATLRASGGWAWSERTVRGHVEGEWRRGAWVPSFTVGRSLDITNDFLAPFDSGTSSIAAAVFSVDDRDYVDRRLAAIGVTRLFGLTSTDDAGESGASGTRSALVRLEVGGASDRYVAARLDHGLLFHPDSSFRPNRGVLEGAYLRTMLTFQLHPDVSAEFVRPGMGASLRYERGDGQLAYQRLEARFVARENRGAATFALRADGGVLWSHEPPPQQLFELGRGQHLPGYGYKEFAGDRAAVVRTLAMWRLPLWRAPLHVRGRWWLPAPTPALAAGAQSGWTEASSDAARLATARLGSLEDVVGAPPLPIGVGHPVSRPTDGIRSTIDLGLRFFGGSTTLGVARAVDHPAKWRWVLGFGAEL